MKINLSTGWRFDIPLSLKNSFIWANEFDFDGVELVMNSETLFKSKNSIKSLSEKYQVPIRSIHCPIVTMPFLWPIKYGVDNTFKYASFFNASLVVIHPPKLKGYQIPEGQTLLNYLDQMKEKYPDIKITLENFENFNKDTERNLENLKKLLDEHAFNLTFDTTHIGFSNYDLFEAYNLLKDKIINIHFSNYQVHAEHLPPYQGDLPLEKLLKQLKNDNYNGNITLEILYNPFVSNKRVKADVEKSIKFIRKALNA